MNKKLQKIFFAVVAVCLVIFLVFICQRPYGDSSAERQKAKNVERLEKDYQQQAKSALSGFKQAVEGGQMTAEQIALFRQKLLDLKVPTKFKDLHLDLILSLVKLEDALKKSDRQAVVENQELINQALADYQWLN